MVRLWSSRVLPPSVACKIKYIEAKQARAIYHFKNTKRKLYRTNAAIWYNKTCKQSQLTPDYIKIKINGKNLRCQISILSITAIIVPMTVDTVKIVLLMMGVCAALNMYSGLAEK